METPKNIISRGALGFRLQVELQKTPGCTKSQIPSGSQCRPQSQYDIFVGTSFPRSGDRTPPLDRSSPPPLAPPDSSQAGAQGLLKLHSHLTLSPLQVRIPARAELKRGGYISRGQRGNDQLLPQAVAWGFRLAPAGPQPSELSLPTLRPPG